MRSDVPAKPMSPDAVRACHTLPRITHLDALYAVLAARGVRRDMLSGLQRQYERLGPVVGQISSERFVHLYGPDANRFVLLDRDRIFSARPPWMQIMGRIFPNGLLLMDGPRHAHDRRMMRAPFTRSALEEYGDRINALVESHLPCWLARYGPRVRMFPRFEVLTLEVAARIFLGVELGRGASRMSRVLGRMVAASMSRVRLPVPGLEFHRGLMGRAYMQRFLAGQIEQRRQGQGTDLFSRLCRARDALGAPLSEQQVLDHIIFLMMAAHDTTASALASVTYELARHPEWQERVREESLGLGTGWLDLECAERHESLDWVIREALRRYPPVPVIPRMATRAFEWQGYRIAAGATVVIAPIHTHYMQEWWSDPSRFDPERFSPARAEDMGHTHAWIPFGGGTHLCLGRRFAELQIRLILHQLVCGYRWRVPSGYRMPVQQAPISRPRDGLPVLLERI